MFQSLTDIVLRKVTDHDLRAAEGGRVQIYTIHFKKRLQIDFIQMQPNFLMDVYLLLPLALHCDKTNHWLAGFTSSKRFI